MKEGDRVYHPLYGYGTVVEDLGPRVHVAWDDKSEGGADVNQLGTEEEATKKGY
jgi:hypothetical protein